MASVALLVGGEKLLRSSERARESERAIDMMRLPAWRPKTQLSIENKHYWN